MKKLQQETLGFAAVKMIRRIVGLAHVEDFESISDTTLRAQCERKALHLAREMLVNKSTFDSLQAIIQRAREIQDAR